MNVKSSNDNIEIIMVLRSNNVNMFLISWNTLQIMLATWLTLDYNKELQKIKSIQNKNLAKIRSNCFVYYYEWAYYLR